MRTIKVHKFIENNNEQGITTRYRNPIYSKERASRYEDNSILGIEDNKFNIENSYVRETLLGKRKLALLNGFDFDEE